MNRLPFEIKQKIFTQLELRDRLICTLVCRKWWEVLDSTCLLHTVEICNNQGKLLKFIDMIKQSPHRALQVQELNICNSLGERIDKRKICKVFPSARVINVSEKKFGVYVTGTVVAHSKSTVEVLHDSGYCQLAMQIMDSNLGDRLKELFLDLKGSVPYSRSIVPDLKNMPVLEMLSLSSFSTSVMDLEILHENVPSIQSLKLNFISPRASKFPANITPATLTYLQYHSVSYEYREALPIFYQYMSRKYTNLTKVDYYDSSFADLLTDNNRQLYENGFLQFLQLIGPISSEKALCGIPRGINVFEVLDNSNSKTTSLTFNTCDGITLFQLLAQSNQARYVERLCLQKTIIGTPNSLLSLTSLTSLELDFYPLDIIIVDLTWIYTGFPASLERCAVRAETILADKKSTHSSSIKYLQLECKKIPKGIGKVLSNCFPNLVNFELIGDVKESMKINIKSPNFQRAVFLNRKKASCDRGFSFKSGSQNSYKHYLWSPDSIVDSTYMKILLLPTISFVSSMKNKLNASFDDGKCIWIESLDS